MSSIETLTDLRQKRIFLFAIMLCACAMLAIAFGWGGSSLADPYTEWDRSYFMPVTGSEITGLSPAGIAHLSAEKDLVIPAGEGITTIADHAFQSLALESVNLPASITTIGEYAFANNEITTVNLQDTQVTTVAPHAFRNNKLTAITLPAGCTKVNEGAFLNNLIASVAAPDVAQVGPKAFANNKLTTITLDNLATDGIAADGFDGNGRVVAIQTVSANAVTSYFAGGSGFVVNPVKIKVNYLNQATGTAFRAPDILGEDFTSNNLYPSGIAVTVNAPAVTGWTAQAPTSYTQTLPATGVEEFNFTYKSSFALPIINVTNKRFDLGSPAISQATAQSWVTATSGVDGSIITNIIASVEAPEVFPLSTAIERDVEVTFRVTDIYGNTGMRTITVVLAPSSLYDYIIPGKGWQYIDFTYGTGAAANQVTGLNTSVPGYGLDKYNDTLNPFAKDIVLPGFNPYTNDMITTITSGNPTITGVPAAEVTTTGQFGNKDFNSINLSRVLNLNSIGTSAFAFSKATRLDLITSGGGNLTIGAYAFNQAQLTQLDFRGFTGNITVGSAATSNSAFQNSPLTTLVFETAPRNASLYLGTETFRSAQIEELDLSGFLGSVTIGEANYSYGSAFLNAPLKRLRFNTIPTNQPLIIGYQAFPNARLTELDLSGRTGRVEIGQITYNGGLGAFQNSPIESLSIGASSADLIIGWQAFNSAKLTMLDLSGRTGRIQIGLTGTGANTPDNGAFRNSPIQELLIGASDKPLIFGANAFYNAKITELDLSGRTGEIRFNYCLHNWDNGVFRNAPLQKLLIGPSTEPLEIGPAAFLNARLTELDLSGRTGPVSIGPAGNESGGSFQNSPLVSLMFNTTPSSQPLYIGMNTFQSAVLTELDLSGRIGEVTLGLANTNDQGAFRNSPLTSLKIAPSSSSLTIGLNAFFNARLTELDLSGRTGSISIGNAYQGTNSGGSFRNSPLTSLKIGPSALPLQIGMNAFREALLTELDLSGRTGTILLGGTGGWDDGVFRNSPITSLKIGPGSASFEVHCSAFMSAKLTELDLSGRTGLIRIGDPANNWGDEGAFRNSPITSLKFGSGTATLLIGENAFLNAKLTALDLSGRTGQIRLGSNDSQQDQGAFRNSPLETLRIGPGHLPLMIGTNAFYNAQLTELDLSGREGTITIGYQGKGVNYDLGAFYNSPITNLQFSTVSTPTTGGVFVGAYAFYNAKLISLDLSNNGVRTIGHGAFFNSTFDSLVIGRLIGSLADDRNNLYTTQPAIAPGHRIVSHTSELPITILQNDTDRAMLPKVPGYVLNPIYLTVRYVESGNPSNELWPAREIVLQYPYDSLTGTDAPIHAQSIYGWQPVVAIEHLKVDIPVVPQIVYKEIVFEYTPFNPGTLTGHDFSLTQGAFRPYGLIGDLLITDFTLKWGPVIPPIDDSGFMVKVYYDSKRVEFVNFSDENPFGVHYTFENDASAGVLTFTFPNGTPDGTTGMVGPGIIWRLIPGYTEEFTPQPIRAQFEAPSKDVYCVANEVNLSGYYLRPIYRKNAGDYYGEVDSTTNEFTSVPSLTYTYSIIHPVTGSTTNAIPRTMESIIITDTLPTYTALNYEGTPGETTELAVFNPALNPGWILSSDGKTVTWTNTNAFVGNTTIPRLVLQFPYAKPFASVFNRIDAEKTPYNASSVEGPWTGSASRGNTLYPIYRPGVIGKWVTSTTNDGTNLGNDVVRIRNSGSPSTTENINGWFVGLDLVEKPEIVWRLTLAGSAIEPDTYYDNISFTDSNLDARLMYVAVHTGTLGKAFIRAYDASGTILEQAGPVSGRYEFNPAIAGDITKVEIYGSDKIVPKSTNPSDFAQTYIITKMRDADMVGTEYPGVLGAPAHPTGTRFDNQVQITADLRDKQATTIETLNSTTIGHTFMRDLMIGISKTQNQPAVIPVSGSLDLIYTLKFDHYDAGTSSSALGTTNVAITGIEIIDVLPDFFEFERFVPSPELINATRDPVTGLSTLSWKTESPGFTDNQSPAKNHDILIITADYLRIGSATSIGRIEGKVASWTPPNTSVDNHVYLSADTPFGVAYGGMLTNSTNTPIGIDNPFGAKGIAMSKTELIVVSTKDVVGRKYIRAQNDDGTWPVWNSAGIITPAGTDFQYRLSLLNNSDYQVGGIGFVDVLPTSGDAHITLPITGGNDRIARGSVFDNTLVDVIVPPGYRWEFITEAVPSDYANGMSPTFKQSADRWFDDVARTWYDGATATPLQRADATAIRVELDPAVTPAHVVSQGESIDVIVSMKANNDAFTYAAERAYNSSAIRYSLTSAGAPVGPPNPYMQANIVFNEIPDLPAEIRLMKRSGTSGATYLAGAVFELYRVTDEGLAFVASATSQGAPNLGLVVFSGIERDNYVIKEVTAPANHLPNATDITVNKNQFTKPTPTTPPTPPAPQIWTYNAGNVNNTPYGNFIIEKRDANGKLVPNIEFRFTPPAGQGSAFTQKTDANGRIVLEKIAIGTWGVAEVALPGNLRPISFNLTVTQTATTGPNGQTPSNPNMPTSTTLVTFSAPYVFTVHNKVAQVTLHKIGVLSSAGWNTPPTQINPVMHSNLQGVLFDLYIVPTNVVGGAGNLVNNTLAQTAANGQYLYQGNTASNFIVPNQLYYFVERPTGQPTSITNNWDLYAQDPTLADNRHYFWIDETGKLWNANPNDPTQNAELYSTGRVVIKNKQKERDGYLTINKYDWSKDENGAVNRIPFPVAVGATFRLQKQDALTGTWVTIGDYTTDASGKIGPINVKTGSYQFFELSTPDGYLTDETIRRFTVNGSNDNQQFTYNIDNVAITPKIVKGNSVGIYNPKSTIELNNLNKAYEYLTVTKGIPASQVHKMVDSLGRINLIVGLGGAEFEIREYAGLSTDAPLVGSWDNVTSDGDGVIDLSGLNPALVFKEGCTYTFKETLAPTGYTGSSQVYTYQPRTEAEAIIANGGKWIPFDNRAAKHRIILSKYSADTKSALAGAQFTLWHPDHTEVFPGTTFTTNATGLIEFDNLVPGVYYLEEVVAPQDYDLITSVFRFEIIGQSNESSGPGTVYGSPDWFETNRPDDIIAETATSGDIFKVLYNYLEEPDTSLTVKKTVAGPWGASSDEKAGSFTFVISTMDGSIRTPAAFIDYILYENDADENGTPQIADADGRFTLGHGQRASFFGMAIGDVYHLEEIADEAWRTTSKVTYEVGSPVTGGNEATVEITGHDKVNYTNARQFAFPLTGGSGLARTIMTGALVTLIAIGAAITSQRRTRARTYATTVLLIMTAAIMVLAPISSARAETVTIDQSQRGSITINKFLLNDLRGAYPAGDGRSVNDLPHDASPLEGIAFKLQSVEPLRGPLGTRTVLATLEGEQWISSRTGIEATITTGSDGRATLAGLPDGFYLVTELPSARVADGVYPFIVAVPTAIDQNGEDLLVYDVQVYPKNMDVAITKEIEYDDSTRGVVDSLGIGDSVHWVIGVDIPSRIAEAKLFAIHDDYSIGLAHVSGSVKLVGVTQSHADVVLSEGVHYTVSESGTGPDGGGRVTATMTQTGLNALDGCSRVEMRVETIVLPSAMIATPLPNVARLEYHDPGGGITERASSQIDEAPAVHTGGVRMQKADARTKKALAGASFKLVKKSSDDYAADLKANGYVQRDGSDYVVTSDARGIIDIVGLAYGGRSDHETGHSDYWIIETKAPVGYIKPTQAGVIRVDAESYNTDAPKYQMLNEAQIPSPLSPLFPKTGDPLSWIPSIGIFVAALALITFSRKRKAATVPVTITDTRCTKHHDQYDYDIDDQGNKTAGTTSRRMGGGARYG